MEQKDVFEKLEMCLKDYKTFEDCIIKCIGTNYYPLVYQSLYVQLGYENLKHNKFKNSDFKKLVRQCNFLDIVNEIYRTRLSKEGIRKITDWINEDNFNFDDYGSALEAFRECNPRNYKNKGPIYANAWSFGTKLLHFYSPNENPILDSVVRNNLGLGDMSYKICIEFHKAANDFTKKHEDYFEKIIESKNIECELEKRNMSNKFPKMAILDMALYQ